MVISSNPKRVLLFVHGRDFKPSAEEFFDLSNAALTTGIERDYPNLIDRFHALDKQMAYYGDLSNDFLSGRGLRYDETLDIGDRRNALIKIRALDKKKNFSVTRYDRLPWEDRHYRVPCRRRSAGAGQVGHVVDAYA